LKIIIIFYLTVFSIFQGFSQSFFPRIPLNDVSTLIDRKKFEFVLNNFFNTSIYLTKNTNISTINKLSKLFPEYIINDQNSLLEFMKQNEFYSLFSIDKTRSSDLHLILCTYQNNSFSPIIKIDENYDSIIALLGEPNMREGNDIYYIDIKKRIGIRVNIRLDKVREVEFNSKVDLFDYKLTTPKNEM